MGDQDGRFLRVVAHSYLWQVPVGAAVLVVGLLLVGPFPANLLLAVPIAGLTVLMFRKDRRRLGMSRRRPSE